MILTRRGVPRYRPRLPKSFTCHLLTTDGKQEIEGLVEVYVDDWGENSIDCVMLHGWDIEGLLSVDERDQIDAAIVEQKAILADEFEAAEEDYGDYLMELRRDG